MDYILTFLIGFLASSAVWVSAMQRAAKKPEGKTAKFLKALTG